jgi:hypothetical protein
MFVCLVFTWLQYAGTDGDQRCKDVMLAPTVSFPLPISLGVAAFRMSYAFAKCMRHEDNVFLPTAGATCPPNAIAVSFGNRTFCKFCPGGQYKKASSDSCVPCPKGTHQDLVGATSCKPCPAGSTCFEGDIAFNRCMMSMLLRRCAL